MHPAIALRLLPAGFLLRDDCGRRERRGSAPNCRSESPCKFQQFLRTSFVDIIFKKL